MPHLPYNAISKMRRDSNQKPDKCLWCSKTEGHTDWCAETMAKRPTKPDKKYKWSKEGRITKLEEPDTTLRDTIRWELENTFSQATISEVNTATQSILDLLAKYIEKEGADAFIASLRNTE